MAAAILSNAVGSYVLGAIASRGAKTLHELAADNAVQPGTAFIYNGHFYGKGFGYSNKGPALTLTEKLAEPLEGKKLVLEFAKDGLVNETAFTRMSGPTTLFAFAYITEVTATMVRAVPYAIGDLITGHSPVPLPFASTIQLQPEDIEQFGAMDKSWMPSNAELLRLADISEHQVKELICRLLGEHEVPKDWGGEESDLFSARLTVAGTRQTGAFLLKGPSKFHPMTPSDLGKNADQIYRLFNIPADIFVVQHCTMLARRCVRHWRLTLSPGHLQRLADSW